MLVTKKTFDKELPQKIIQVHTALMNEIAKKQCDFDNHKAVYIAITIKCPYDYKMVRIIQKIHTSNKWTCSLEKYRKSIGEEGSYIYVWVFRNAN